MAKCVICVGISASGKSTFAESLCKKDKSWINVNRDDLRFTLTHTCGWKEYKFNKSIEDMVTELQKSTCALAYKQGKNVIISDTNLNSKTRKMWDEYLTRLGFEIEYKDFPIDIQEAIRRDLKRLNSVGYEVIHKQWGQWLDYIDHKKYEMKDGGRPLPSAIIFDIDGTLASMDGIRGPFEWDKVDQDTPVGVIVDMAFGFSGEGYDIVCLSGRDGSCEKLTQDWLINHVWCYDALFMRAPGDTRKDSIVKEELFWDCVAPRWNVHAILDDRPQVCRMWRDLGLKVIQVADPYKEF
jgi:predicted kinase